MLQTIKSNLHTRTTSLGIRKRFSGVATPKYHITNPFQSRCTGWLTRLWLISTMVDYHTLCKFSFRHNSMQDFIWDAKTCFNILSKYSLARCIESVHDHFYIRKCVDQLLFCIIIPVYKDHILQKDQINLVSL